MQLVERSRLAGVILNLLGDRRRGIRLSEAGLQVLGPSSQDIPFCDLAGPVILAKRLWFHGVSLSLAGGSDVRIVGLKRDAAALTHLPLQPLYTALHLLDDLKPGNQMKPGIRFE